MINMSTVAPARCPNKQRHLDLIFAKRIPFDEAQLWEKCFRTDGIALDTVARVRRILCDVLEVDLFRIRAKDSFTKELSFLWDLDSLADLKIVHALEEEFNITISNAEAEAMKTLRDLVLGVHAKVLERPSS
jgi:acyl carrier protein